MFYVFLWASHPSLYWLLPPSGMFQLWSFMFKTFCQCLSRANVLQTSTHGTKKQKQKKKAQTLNKCLRSRCRTNIFKHGDEKRKHSQKTSHDFLDNRLKCPTLESYHKWKCILCVLSVFFYYNAKKISFICLSWCQKIIKLTASSTMQFFSLLWFIIQFHLKTAQQSKNT